MAIADGQEETRGSPLTTIKRTQRSEEVRLQIERAIRAGDFAPGDRLPSERELVETFGVSRVSVREAIRSSNIRLFNKPIKPAALRAMLGQWSKKRMVAAE